MSVFSGPNCVYKTTLLAILYIYTVYLVLVLVVPIFGFIIAIYSAGVLLLIWCYIIDSYSGILLTKSSLNNIKTVKEDYIFKKNNFDDLKNEKNLDLSQLLFFLYNNKQNIDFEKFLDLYKKYDENLKERK